jgi:hypothetical protein
MQDGSIAAWRVTGRAMSALVPCMTVRGNVDLQGVVTVTAGNDGRSRVEATWRFDGQTDAISLEVARAGDAERLAQLVASHLTSREA